ncbi:MAG TPA: CDP-alcohol phosphatidyltransferase family protein [Actinomycetota bacterium]
MSGTERTSGAVGPASSPDSSSLDRIATVPNALSLARILLIPLFVVLILHRGTEAVGLIVLLFVVGTDWVDGYIARHTGQVSNLGKVLDPVADRLAIASGLVAVVVRDAFPLWAALLVIVRDALVIAAGGLVLLIAHVRIDVRWIGKLATFWLMSAIPLIAWGNFHLFLHQFALPFGWITFWLGIAAYYVAGVMYAFDIARAMKASRREPANQARL